MLTTFSHHGYYLKNLLKQSFEIASSFPSTNIIESESTIKRVVSGDESVIITPQIKCFENKFENSNRKRKLELNNESQHLVHIKGNHCDSGNNSVVPSKEVEISANCQNVISLSLVESTGRGTKHDKGGIAMLVNSLELVVDTVNFH